jgi:hypothetical protein
VSPDFERLVGRAILDPEFRRKLLDDPDGTVDAEGFAISEAERDQIRQAAKDREATEKGLGSIGLASTWH